MINKPRKQSMRQVKDEALAQSPTYKRAVAAIQQATTGPLKPVSGGPVRFVRGARARDQLPATKE